jgi:flagellar FliL protein
VQFANGLSLPASLARPEPEKTTGPILQFHGFCRPLFDVSLTTIVQFFAATRALRGTPMAKEPVKRPPAADEAEANATGEEAAAPKKRWGRKFLLMVGAGGLVLLLGIAAGAYFLFFARSAPPKSESANALPLVPPQVAYYDMPDMVVNIQSQDGSPAYLKLGVALELDSAAEKPGLQVLMPRVVDQFQSYLRELRVDDLRGSAGVVRIKEELLRRINVAAQPYRVRDVLLKEMIVQ